MIEKVLEAARFAPSGHNEQTTEFVVIQGASHFAFEEQSDQFAQIVGEFLDRVK